MNTASAVERFLTECERTTARFRRFMLNEPQIDEIEADAQDTDFQECDFT